MPPLEERIKEKAMELGFARVGIVPAVELDIERTRLEEWLARGYQGSMAWMERDPEKRADPRKLFPPAKSVIVLAMNYFTPHDHRDTANSGKISRYAWGDDYHEILRQGMDELLQWIRTESPGAEGKICVDTSPVMDKAWAVRAGLGWLGKHTNVINAEIGSWFFIGEILLNLDLAADIEIVADHCGTCTACIDACPTGAIVEPYVVDSRKCISYATIEMRDDALPVDIAEHLNGWLYGCDICQDVCPWNRFERPVQEPAFEPRNGETSLDLDAVLRLDQDRYAERFRGSPIKRTKLSGLKRNARYLKMRIESNPSE
ncbi:MAG TPA: tRNA epoxyqueuosine(34) reductase QueG [Pyrinomonadaceae bacterium]|nr:tRNA epoxyqueuosine(34) reductase QueG [Pyrinomonadaceae bacterium]